MGTPHPNMPHPDMLHGQVHDDLGCALPPAGPAERVVSLVPSLTESVTSRRCVPPASASG